MSPSRGLTFLLAPLFIAVAPATPRGQVIELPILAPSIGAGQSGISAGLGTAGWTSGSLPLQTSLPSLTSPGLTPPSPLQPRLGVSPVFQQPSRVSIGQPLQDAAGVHPSTPDLGRPKGSALSKPPPLAGASPQGLAPAVTPKAQLDAVASQGAAIASPVGGGIDASVSLSHKIFGGGGAPAA